MEKTESLYEKQILESIEDAIKKIQLKAYILEQRLENHEVQKVA